MSDSVDQVPAWLRYSVYGMGIAFILGVVVLFTMIATKTQGEKDKVIQVDRVISGCVEGQLTLSTAHAVQKIMRQGQNVLLLTKPFKGKQELILLDPCANRVINTVTMHYQKKAKKRQKDSAVKK